MTYKPGDVANGHVLADDGRWYPMPPVSPTFNGLASWSLVFALLWGFGLFSLFAVIFGHIALRQIRERHQDGKPVAVLGLILGYLGFLLPVVFWLAVAVQTAAP